MKTISQPLNAEAFEPYIKQYVAPLGILNEHQQQLAGAYLALVHKQNQVMNLTAITDPKEMVLLHLLDSLSLVDPVQKVLNGCAKRVLDIGSGAGFPGIPLKLSLPEIEITLLDSLNKRIKFLEQVAKDLQLPGVSAVHSRAEDFAKNERASFDIVTARAVARLHTLLEYMLPLTRLGGYCIALKGSHVEEEVTEAQTALRILGGKIEQIIKLELPEGAGTRALVVIKKIKDTPKRYPRSQNQARKDPLI